MRVWKCICRPKNRVFNIPLFSLFFQSFESLFWFLFFIAFYLFIHRNTPSCCWNYWHFLFSFIPFFSSIGGSKNNQYLYYYRGVFIYNLILFFIFIFPFLILISVLEIRPMLTNFGLILASIDLLFQFFKLFWKLIMRNSNVLPNIYAKFWFYNLTNPEDVLKKVPFSRPPPLLPFFTAGSFSQRAIPAFKKVGPYVYLQCRHRVDVTLRNNSEQVRIAVLFLFVYFYSDSSSLLFFLFSWGDRWNILRGTIIISRNPCRMVAKMIWSWVSMNSILLLPLMLKKKFFCTVCFVFVLICCFFSLNFLKVSYFIHFSQFTDGFHCFFFTVAVPPAFLYFKSLGVYFNSIFPQYVLDAFFNK